MSCAPSNAIDICPTADDIQPQILALLPRGRAWGTHDGGPWPDTVLYRFWYAVADVLAWVNAAICALLLEFSCRTATFTRDLWMEEYGLPDGCDPYPDLCTKVAAVGGTRCDFYQSIAARAGWAITCTDKRTACGRRAGRGRVGGSRTGRGLRASELLISVSLSNSAALSGLPVPGATVVGPPPPRAGSLRAGRRLSCGRASGRGIPRARALRAGRKLACQPDLSPLKCLLARVVHGHITVIYETVP